MLKRKCYDNVLQTSGVLQQFISRCVVGGRVVTNSTERYHVKHKTVRCLFTLPRCYVFHERCSKRVT